MYVCYRSSRQAAKAATRVRVQVPWAALGRQQVQVEIDRLYIIAVPSYSQEGTPPEDEAAEEERLEASKRAEVFAAEQQWAANVATQDEAGAVAAQPGYVQGVVNVVLGNLKLKVCFCVFPEGF